MSTRRWPSTPARPGSPSTSTTTLAPAFASCSSPRPARPAPSSSAPASLTPHPDRPAPPAWPSPTSKPPTRNSPRAASLSAASGTSHPSTTGKAATSQVPTPSAATTPASPTSPTPTATPGSSRRSAITRSKTPAAASPQTDPHPRPQIHREEHAWRTQLIRRSHTMTPVTYRTTDVNGLKVFYRESGHPGAPKLLLLHGYPSASHMFRDLIPQLSDRFHIVAPDLLGF